MQTNCRRLDEHQGHRNTLVLGLGAFLAVLVIYPLARFYVVLVGEQDRLRAAGDPGAEHYPVLPARLEELLKPPAAAGVIAGAVLWARTVGKV